MTKNKNLNEIRLAMKAGQYADLNTREEKIYRNAFVNGYKLAKKHLPYIVDGHYDPKES